MHEKVASSVVQEILRQLSSIACLEGPSAELAREVIYHGSADIVFDDPDYGKHSPDASFGHSRAQYPGVIIEISYLQKRKDLSHLADDYILGSDGNIHAVVGLDVDYKGNLGSLSVWRPVIKRGYDGVPTLQAEKTVANQVSSVMKFALHTLTSVRYFATKTANQTSTQKPGYFFSLGIFVLKR